MTDETKRHAAVMAGQNDPGDVFCIPELWSAPKYSYLDQLPQDAETLFFGSPQLTDPRQSMLQLVPSTTQGTGFFKYPGQEPRDAEPESGEEEPTETSSSLEPVQDDDLWMDLDGPMPEPATLRTWESFISQQKPVNNALLITEAGPGAYDALLAQADDPVNLQSAGVPVVDQATYFQSLLALALGRESVLFQRDATGRDLKPVLTNTRMPGYSAGILQGLEKQCRHCGRVIAELNTLIRRTYSKDSLQCQTALASVLDEILQAIQQNVIAPSQRPRSLLQIRRIVQRITSILRPLYKLASKLDRARSNEEIVSHVFEHTSTQSVEKWLQDIFQIVLCRVSGPWTDFIEEWIGTRREKGIPFTKTEANIGRYKGFVKVDAVLEVDESGEEVSVVDYRLDQDNVPPFMPGDIVQALFEAGSNLRFIHTAHPEHPLSQPDLLSRTKPPQTSWLFEWDSILELEAKVTEYRGRLLEALNRDTVSQVLSFEIGPKDPGAGGRMNLGIFEIDEMGLQERIQASQMYLDTKIPDMKVNDSAGPINFAVRQCFSSSNDATSNSISTTPHWSLLPVLCFGGIISSQAQIINREMLRLLFAEHDLRANLNLQRQFQLLGNGVFCSRLSHALFDPDVERTDRQAGVARQGGTMGLRLGRRETWPPASSELRLALMGVLTETYSRGRSSDNQADSDVELPGDLSFAVRDLAEEEINKCMDADSLEALDFLRLQYKTPDELRSVISPEMLAQYDHIFKHLLRILRVLFVTNQLSREVLGNRGNPDPIFCRFVREANHFVASISSYFLDSGITMPWQAFEKKLDAVEERLKNAPSETVSLADIESPEQLRSLHSRVLRSILSALFLRKRQEPILQLITDSLSIILDFATCHRDGGIDSPEGAKLTEVLYKKLKKKIQIFITVCRGLTERNRGNREKEGGVGSTVEGMGEESMVTQLLLRLDINNYYTK
jgi:hypothetical protein